MTNDITISREAAVAICTDLLSGLISGELPARFEKAFRACPPRAARSLSSLLISVDGAVFAPAYIGEPESDLRNIKAHFASTMGSIVNPFDPRVQIVISAYTKAAILCDEDIITSYEEVRIAA